MRLSPRLSSLIKKAAKYSFGDVEIYLFGSRTDDFKIGGDIDIAIESFDDRDTFRKKKVKFKTFLFLRGYDLKIDIVQLHKQMDKLLYTEIKETSIKL
jgi:predicted nucleotidyltransferase